MITKIRLDGNYGISSANVFKPGSFNFKTTNNAVICIYRSSKSSLIREHLSFEFVLFIDWIKLEHYFIINQCEYPGTLRPVSSGETITSHSDACQLPVTVFCAGKHLGRHHILTSYFRLIIVPFLNPRKKVRILTVFSSESDRSAPFT